MELLTNKSIAHKIIIALVFVILFNFISPQISFGGIGGALFEPIKDITLTIGDGTIWVMQKAIFGMDTSLLKIMKPESGWIAAAARSSGRSCYCSNRNYCNSIYRRF